MEDYPFLKKIEELLDLTLTEDQKRALIYIWTGQVPKTNKNQIPLDIDEPLDWSDFKDTGPCLLRDMLADVLDEEPSLSDIESWSKVMVGEAAHWATAVLSKKKGTMITVPPKPGFL